MLNTYTQPSTTTPCPSLVRRGVYLVPTLARWNEKKPTGVHRVALVRRGVRRNGGLTNYGSIPLPSLPRRGRGWLITLIDRW